MPSPKMSAALPRAVADKSERVLGLSASPTSLPLTRYNTPPLYVTSSKSSKRPPVTTLSTGV